MLVCCRSHATCHDTSCSFIATPHIVAVLSPPSLCMCVPASMGAQGTHAQRALLPASSCNSMGSATQHLQNCAQLHLKYMTVDHPQQQLQQPPTKNVLMYVQVSAWAALHWSMLQKAYNRSRIQHTAQPWAPWQHQICHHPAPEQQCPTTTTAQPQQPQNSAPTTPTTTTAVAEEHP